MPYFLLLRPHQYVKNTFVLLPLFFAQQFDQISLVGLTLLGVVAFCCVASAIYILNDYQDLAENRAHPTKKHRPMAAGTVKIPLALGLGVILVVTGLAVGWLLGDTFFYTILAYFLLNLAYNLGLKHISIIDVMMIACGFVLRVVAGGAVSQVPVSLWIIIMTFLLALFLGFAKRREDVQLSIEEGIEVRKASSGYNLEFINAAMLFMSPIIMVSYLFYTISSEVMQRFNSENLYITSVFVIMGLLRYMQITFVENRSGAPTKVLLTDRFLQMSILGWILSFTLIIYIL